MFNLPLQSISLIILILDILCYAAALNNNFIGITGNYMLIALALVTFRIYCFFKYSGNAYYFTMQ